MFVCYIFIKKMTKIAQFSSHELWSEVRGTTVLDSTVFFFTCIVRPLIGSASHTSAFSEVGHKLGSGRDARVVGVRFKVR